MLLPPLTWSGMLVFGMFIQPSKGMYSLAAIVMHEEVREGKY